MHQVENAIITSVTSYSKPLNSSIYDGQSIQSSNLFLAFLPLSIIRKQIFQLLNNYVVLQVRLRKFEKQYHPAQYSSYQRHESLMAELPEAGVVYCLLGSDSKSPHH